MQSSYEKVKQAFENLKLTEKIKQLTKLKKQSLNNFNKKCDTPMIIGLFSLVTAILIVAVLSKSLLYSFMTALLALSYTIICCYNEEKFKGYFYKKSGYTYYKNETIEYLQQTTVQVDIINYFNAVVKTNHNTINIQEENKALKNAFIEHDYDNAIVQIEAILNKIQAMHEHVDNLNNEKQRIEDYEKMIGAIALNHNEENELEMNGSFKQYL